MSDWRYLLLPLLFLLHCFDVLLWAIATSADWGYRKVAYARFCLHDFIARRRHRL